MSESFSDSLEKKLNDVLPNCLFALLASFIRPIATLTEIYSRKEMGERYFNGWNVLGGLLAILFFRWPLWDIGDKMQKTTDIFAVVWGLQLLFCSYMSREEKIERYKKGVRWHSLNCGIPRYENLPVAIEKTIPLVVGILFFIFTLRGMGALILLSGGVSLYLRYYEAQLFHSRMLDMIDSQIEQDNFAKAIVDRLSPQQAEGLRVHVSKHASKESLEKFVRARGLTVESKPSQTP